MRKLGGTDASFLYNETLNTPQHVGAIQYLEVPEERKETFFDEVRAVYADRIHLLDYLTSRVQVMPWNIDHPAWVRYPQFDLDEHLHHITLDAPGTDAQLQALVAGLYEPVLDREKPLWKAWVIDGLDSGLVAVFTKTHHACIDGMASIAMAETLGDLEPEIRDVEPPGEDFWRNDDTSYARLMLESWANLTRYRIDQWSRWPAQVRANVRATQRYWQDAEQRGAMTLAPKAPWNAAIDAKRSFAGTHMSLSRLKQIGKAVGVKINDVVLGLTAEALNRYLERQGAALDGPMVSGCPVSLRKPGDTSMNNQVTMMAVSIENHIADPIERLKSIHEASNAAKGMLAEMSEVTTTDFGGPFVPAMLTAAAQAEEAGTAADNVQQVPINLVVSNVPGLQVPLYWAGARVVANQPMSIVAHGGGLNVTVMSYMDRMDLGLTAARNVVPDVDALRDDFVAAYEHLQQVVLGEQAVDDDAQELWAAAG